MENFGWNLVLDLNSGLLTSKLLFYGANFAIEGLGQEVPAAVIGQDKQRTGLKINCRIISSIVHEELDALGLANSLAFQSDNTIIYFHDSRGEVTRIGYIDGYRGRLRTRGSIETIQSVDGISTTLITLEDPVIGMLEINEPLCSSKRIAKMYMGEVWACSAVEPIRNDVGNVTMYVPADSLSKYQPEHTAANHTVAVKWIRKSRIPSQHHSIHNSTGHGHPAASEPLREMDTYNYILGHTVSQTCGLLRPLGLIETSFLYGIVMPFYRGGDLFEYIQSYAGSWTEQICKSIFKQVVSSLASLHALGICHRDLSAENIMLDIDDNTQIVRDCVLGDFGQAIMTSTATTNNRFTDTDDALEFDGNSDNKNSALAWESTTTDASSLSLSLSAVSTVTGLYLNERTYKKLYRPPELVDADLVARHPYVNYFKCDMYALGIILYIIVTRDQPFGPEDWSEQNDFYTLLQDGELPYNSVHVNTFNQMTNTYTSRHCELREVASTSCIDLLASLLTVDPDHRNITLSEVLSHPWLTDSSIAASSGAMAMAMHPMDIQYSSSSSCSSANLC